MADRSANTLNSFDFKYLIGAPLSACVNAQGEAARSTWEFINNVGLDSVAGKGDEKKAVTIEFSYRVGNGEGTEMVLRVPLLTIVPIPYIAIDTVDINFKCKIDSLETETDESTSEYKEDGTKYSTSYWRNPRRVTLRANYSSKKDSKSTQNSEYSVETTLDIYVHARQDAMPAGMAKILDILNNSIDFVNQASIEKGQ